MALELAPGARESCTVSGNTFSLSGAQDGAITFEDAITKTAGTVSGSTVYAYCFENANPSTYEVMEMTFTPGTPDTLTRVSTQHGSNGASAVTFGAGAHTIYRALTEHDMPQLQAVSFSGYITSDFSILSNTVTQVTAITEEWDTGGNFASGTWICPKARRYDIRALVTFAVGADANRLEVRIHKNGGVILSKFVSASSTADQCVDISLTADLALNDAITLNVRNLNSADTIRGGQTVSTFQISSHVVP